MPKQLPTLETELGTVTNAVCKMTATQHTPIESDEVTITILCYLSLDDLNAERKPIFEDSYKDTRTMIATHYTNIDAFLSSVLVSDKGINYSVGATV